MVVHTGLSVSGDNLLVILGRLTGGIEADVQFVLAVCITVIIVELVVKLQLDVVVHPPVESYGISLGSTSVNIAEIEVASLVTTAEFKIAPFVDRLDLGVLSTIGVIALGSAEEQVTSLGIPTAEVLCFGIYSIRFEVDVISYVGRLIAEAFPVTGKLDSPEVVVVKTGQVICVEVLLAVNAGGVTCAGTISSPLSCRQVGSGCAVGICGTDVKAGIVQFVKRTDNQFCGEGITLNSRSKPIAPPRRPATKILRI